MGGITLTTGIFGTWLGGLILDYRGGAAGISGVQRAMELSSVSTAGSIAFAIISVSSDSPAFAFSALTMADFLMFASSAPVNAALLSIVPQQLRSLGMAMSILLMHSLGDLPSPIVVGYVSDQISDVRLTMLVLCGWMSFSVVFWGGAVILIKQRTRKLNEYTQQLLSDPSKLDASTVNQLSYTTTQYQSITT